MKKRIYVAASAPRHGSAKALAELLRKEGHDVVSDWHDQDGLNFALESSGASMDILATRYEGESVRDVLQVRMADILVVITGDQQTRGGRHTELGIALDRGCAVYLLGPREQVFHYHPDVRVVSSAIELVETLAKFNWG